MVGCCANRICASDSFISYRVDRDMVFGLQSFAAGADLPRSLGQVFLTIIT